MNNGVKRLAIAIFLIFSIVLFGCQKELEKKSDTIKIIKAENQKSDADIEKGFGKEFNDDLGQAVDELDQTENISNS